MSVVQPIPTGYESATPYLIIKQADKAIDFYAKVFGAKECYRMPAPDGSIMHAEIRIGASRFMMCEESPACVGQSPLALKGTPVSFYLYVDNVDAVYARAIKEGATSEREIEDRFYGDRVGIIRDPFGHVWSLATHTEEVAPEEIRHRAAAMFNQK